MRAVRLTVFLIFAAFPFVTSGQQDVCLDKGRLEVLRTQIVNASGAKEENAVLQKDFIDTAKSISGVLQRSWMPGKDGQKEKTKFIEDQKAATKKLCSMLNTGQWPTKAAIGEEGMNAFLYLIGRTLTIRMQLELYPLVAAAYEKGEIGGSETLAAYVDRLRIALGRRQLYGTHVIARDGFLVQAPIERATEVDERREKMKLVPLRQYERALEVANKLPLIRAVNDPVGPSAPKRNPAGAAPTQSDSLGLEGDGPEIKLETAFVSVDVNIPDAADGTSVALERSDFKLYDNGKPVEIETFSKAETPFDIVLLLDISGSTSDKLGLIKKSTRRFIEMKRPGDRVAVVAFNDTQTVVSELESDQAALLERVKKIDGNGASAVWASLSFSMDLLNDKSEKGRRRAIVLMSDGADNLLSFYLRLTDKISYADLIESIQNSNITIFPIFLDTFRGYSQSFRDTAYRTLDYIADQSGGTVHTAKKLDDLEDIYDRVLKGVGTVYTLGFSPESESAGRAWRTIKVEVPTRPTLKLRHRPGYFTR